MEIRKPMQGELEAIEAELRLMCINLRFVPKAVRLAGEDQTLVARAWRGEALRYYYLVWVKGIDLTPALVRRLTETAGADVPTDWENL